MTSDPITISTATQLPEARKILNEYQIRNLPVIDRDKKLIGIVTDRDLRSAYPSTVISKAEAGLAFDQVEKTTVEEIMTRSCTTMTLDSTLDDALIIFDREKVGGIPVVSEDGTILGIFSIFDLISAYRKLFGVMKEDSLLIGVEDDGRANILSDLISLLERNNISLSRLIRLEDKRHSDKIFMRISGAEPVAIYNLLKSEGFEVFLS